MVTTAFRSFVRRDLWGLLLAGAGLALCLKSAAVAQDIGPTAADAGLAPELASPATGDARPTQVIYLDFDGALVPEFNGPITLTDLAVPPFRAGMDRGDTDSQYVVDLVMSQLEGPFGNRDLAFTTQLPPPGTAYSTIFIGGENTRFEELGDYVSVAQHVDYGNVDPNDIAVVFSDHLVTDTDSPEELATALTAVIRKTASLLIGHPYDGFAEPLPAVPRACLSDYCLDAGSNNSDTVYLDAGCHTFEVDDIACNRCTRWYVDDILVETDHSGSFFCIDPQLSRCFNRTQEDIIVAREYWNDSCTGSYYTHTWDVTCKAPDVYVASITFTPASPGINDSVEIEARSCNKCGSLYTATGWDLDYRVRINGVPEKTGSHTLGLAACECDDESFLHTFDNCGTYTVEWCEDYTMEEVEWDETNNCRSASVVVGAECGDGICQSACGETASSCCDDCAECCGNNDCNWPCERCSGGNCVPRDACGDGSCNCGETPVSCCEDCGCCDASDCPDPGVCKERRCVSGTCSPASSPAGSPCDDGLHCNGTDTCNGSGSCSSHSGDPCDCDLPDNDCTDCCNESADNCTGPEPSGSACNDGLFCNGSDTCNASGSCSNHSGDPCDCNLPDSDCTDCCNESADNCSASEPTGSPCNDGLFCNGADTCLGGFCSQHAGDPCPGCVDGDANCAECCSESQDNCTAPDPEGSLCDDEDACTDSDMCRAGLCVGTPECSFESDCEDGRFCNGAELCVSGCCEPGAPPCTPGECCDEFGDSCGGSSCTSAGQCIDGDPCTTDDCVDECCVNIPECVSNGGCDDGDLCTDDRCLDGCCDNTPECTSDSDCGDTLYCNGVETCVGGCCEAGAPACAPGQCCDEAGDSCGGTSCTEGADCDDGDPCTTDSCIDECCVYAPVCVTDGDCDDGQFCTGTETCGPNGCCVDGAAPCVLGECCDESADSCDADRGCTEDAHCDDQNGCTTDRCDENGCCTNTPRCTSAAQCNDGNPCTVDRCSAGCCSSTPGCDSDGDCNDGDPCTVDRCHDGCCVSAPTCETDDDCDDNDPCTVARCDNGCCVSTPACDTAVACDDGDPCTVDRCDDGCCVSVPECEANADCDDDDPCTVDVCDDGCCISTPACDTNADCDDGQFCNGPESCQVGCCVDGTPPCDPCCEEGGECDECDSDRDGVPDDRDECPNTPVGAEVEDDGCQYFDWVIRHFLDGSTLNRNEEGIKENEVVPIDAPQPRDGFMFGYWMGDDVPEGHEYDDPLWLTMDSNKNLTAFFQEVPCVTDDDCGAGRCCEEGVCVDAGDVCTRVVCWDVCKPAACMIVLGLLALRLLGPGSSQRRARRKTRGSRRQA